MPLPETLKPLVEIIRAELTKQGVISFARFMALALYCPLHGFYEQKRDTVGRGGHFYTSVSAGPLFGEMLAFRFADWLAELPDASCALQIVEAGAHDGRLAADILNWLQVNRPQLCERLEYVILEPSAARQEWQRHNLAARLALSTQVRWVDTTLRDSKIKFTGIIFSNELLDAMPVHRLGWDATAKIWFEWGVAWRGDTFVWQRLPHTLTSVALHPQLPGDLLAVLPDGYVIEVSPAAEHWWRATADSLTAGRLVTIDYGFSAEELFRPERREGTLRAYHQHRVSHDLLAHVGRQDLTAHVDFAAIQRTGEAAGLLTEGLWPQARFLMQIAEQVWKSPRGFGEWTPARTRQFQTLTHPDHLGRAFRVLVQRR